ncbi:MAG: PEP-CTERM sorting domain-containing protein [Pseudomonadota bacterium]
MSVAKRAKAIGLAAALSIFGLQMSAADAAPINEVDYFSLTVGQTIDFESITGGDLPGTNYDEVLNFGGVLIGERFAGQTLSFSGNSDVLSGTPTGPLSLVAGEPNQNLTITQSTSEGIFSNVVAGLGPVGFPAFNAVGEGAVAILFDNDQSQFGFQSVGGDLGSATFEFFRRDGSLIDTLTPTSLTTDFFGFAREDGINDIAGISIWNTDLAGIGFDNIIFDIPGNDFPGDDTPGDQPGDDPVATPVSEPATLGLLAIGLIGVRLASRRRRSS